MVRCSVPCSLTASTNRAPLRSGFRASGAPRAHAAYAHPQIQRTDVAALTRRYPTNPLRVRFSSAATRRCTSCVELYAWMEMRTKRCPCQSVIGASTR